MHIGGAFSFKFTQSLFPQTFSELNKINATFICFPKKDNYFIFQGINPLKTSEIFPLQPQ